MGWLACRHAHKTSVRRSTGKNKRAHRERGVEQDGVAPHPGVEKMPQGGQMQLAGSDREIGFAQPIEVLADVLGG